jgi:hypothetical protein
MDAWCIDCAQQGVTLIPCGGCGGGVCIECWEMFHKTDCAGGCMEGNAQ